MRKYLKGLQNLRGIAFSHDSYKSKWDTGDNYYYIRIPFLEAAPEDLEGVADLEYGQDLESVSFWAHRQELEEIWERQHRRRKATVLSQERDSCRTLLRRMFGGLL